jgi:hypothetical protein
MLWRLRPELAKRTIKRTRPRFEALLEAIDGEKLNRSASTSASDDKLAKLKEELRQCQAKLNDSLARETALVLYVFDLKRQVKELTAGRVVPIRKR